MRLLRLPIVALAIAITSLLLPAASLAVAPESPAPVPNVTNEDVPQSAAVSTSLRLPSCKQQIAAAVELASKQTSAEGAGSGRAACVSEVPTDKNRLSTVAAETPLPSYCQAHTGQGKYFTRFDSCDVGTVRLTVTNLNTGAITGEADFLFTQISVLSASSAVWRNEVRVTPQNGGIAWGDAKDESVYAVGSCDSGCTIADQSLPSVPLGTSNTATFWLGPQTNVGAGTAKNGASTIQVHFFSPKHIPSSGVKRTDETVRCDRVRSGTGCVHSAYTPTVQFSLSGKTRDVAIHISAAQNSGLPGRIGTTPLKYLADSVLSDRNGNVACPKSWTRPTNKSCDEYPFRSTFQGASTGGGSGRTFSWCGGVPLPTGVTGAKGYSSCWVPANSNSSQGGVLGNFYRDNRIVNGDSFWVGLSA